VEAENRRRAGRTFALGTDHNLGPSARGSNGRLAAALTAGAGDLTLKFGDFTMGGIGTATFGAIILYQILGWNQSKL
jgi:hypothetical protein